MANFPQLIEEDMTRLQAALASLLEKSEARMALIVEKSGYLILKVGKINQEEEDSSTLASLASGSFMATQTIAQLLQESGFTTTFQQGDQYSILVQDVDEFCILLVIFDAGTSLGLVKFYLPNTARVIRDQLKIAHDRNPSSTFDFADLNIEDAQELFRKKG